MSDMYRRDNGYVWSGGRREEAKNLRLLPASRSVSSTCKAEQQLAEERERERDLRFHTLMIQNWYMVRMYTRQPTSIQGPTSKVDISGTVFGRYVKVLYTTYVHRGSTRCKGCKSWKKEKSLLLKVRSLLKLQTFSFLWPPSSSPSSLLLPLLPPPESVTFGRRRRGWWQRLLLNFCSGFLNLPPHMQQIFWFQVPFLNGPFGLQKRFQKIVPNYLASNLCKSQYFYVDKS